MGIFNTILNKPGKTKGGPQKSNVSPYNVRVAISMTGKPSFGYIDIGVMAESKNQASIEAMKVAEQEIKLTIADAKKMSPRDLSNRFKK